MQNISFLPAARQEVIEAYDWYEAEYEGLGTRFSDALETQLARIAENPLQFPLVVQDVRRARLNRFPYSVFFRQADQGLFIIACFHSSRDPKIWQDR